MRRWQAHSAVDLLKLQDRKTLTEIYKPETYSEESETPLDILYQDASYVVVNKPSGLLVHRSNLDARETRFAVQLLRDQLGRRVFPVHRIDKPTSGALLFALDEEALTRATAMLFDNRIYKKYLAIVRGFPPESGIINRPLRKLRDGNRKSKSEDAQPSETRFSSLEYSELKYPTGHYPTTLFSRLPHASYRSPASAEKTPSRDQPSHHRRYDAWRFSPKRFLSRSQWLSSPFSHASDLRFTHPFTDEPLTIQAPVPSDFRDANKACGLD